MKSKKKYTEKFVGITPKDYEELEDRHKKVLNIFSRYKFERILDVGCGDGNFSMLIEWWLYARKEKHSFNNA